MCLEKSSKNKNKKSVTDVKNVSLGPRSWTLEYHLHVPTCLDDVVDHQRNVRVKLPTIWTDEKQRWEESEKGREGKRREEKKRRGKNQRRSKKIKGDQRRSKKIKS